MEKSPYWHIRLFRLIRTDPSLGLSLAYLLLMVVGIVFEYFYFDCWGVNILAYSDFTDFLLFPISDLRVLAFTTVSFLLVSGVYYLNRWLEERYPRFVKFANMGFDKDSKYYFTYLNFSYLSVGVAYVLYAGFIYGQIAYRQRVSLGADRVEVAYHPDLNRPAERKIRVGRTSSFLFLADTVAHAVEIIPFSEHITSIRPLPDSPYRKPKK